MAEKLDEEGKCPHAEFAARHETQRCNTQTCQGDEICIAHKDVCLGIDGSSSLDPKGFHILLNFAKELVAKYEFKYRCQDATKMGVVQFGNCKTMKQMERLQRRLSASCFSLTTIRSSRMQWFVSSI